jgi:spoIIIJ-associated protein
MDAKIFEGKTVEEALENAATELNIPKEGIKYEIIDEGSKGFLKVFSKKARIKIKNFSKSDVKEKVEEIVENGFADLNILKNDNNEKTSNKHVEHHFNDEEVVEFIRDYLTDFFKFFNISIRFDYRHHKTKLNILIFTQGDFIETNNFEEFIYSIKYIINKVVSKKFKTNLKIDVDINEYIKKKILKLKQIAKEVSEKVKIEQRSIKLRPMYPNERRVVHITLKNDRAIKTESIGNGEKKQVIISPVKHKSG